MPSPILLTTWPNTLLAAETAWPPLSRGGSALDAVEAACRYAEDDLTNHTVGRGGWPDASGRVSLDAAVMLSPSKRGGVCFLRHIAKPVSLARRVMERTPHTLLAGAGAEAFAAEQGFIPADDLLTDPAKAAWEKWRKDGGRFETVANIETQQQHHDTIGAVALDQHGTLAAACSTSGLAWKKPGRVGDSPIIGHGLYCEPGIGACVCTGHGELVSGVCGAFLAIECLRRGDTAQAAATTVIDRIRNSYTIRDNDQIGVIVLAANGSHAAAALKPGFTVMQGSENGVVSHPIAV